MLHGIRGVEIHVIKLIKKQVITDKGKHMDLYFTTYKLKVVEKQDSVANIQVTFVEIQVNFNKQ